ncbi:MAG: RelA/SpoT domain-containing protein [Alcanivorax sp.]
MAKINPLFSKKQVARAGDILRDTAATQEDRSWAMDVLSNWRGIHSYPINTFQATLRDKLRNIDTDALVAQRLKRAPSIISKLQRFPGMKLSRMQDIGGLRAVVSDLRKVFKLKENYKKSRFQHELVGEKDYIESPKETGYRGIHLIYKYKNNRVNHYDGLQLELQLRTRLQHAWATSVETMGTFLNHALKSSEGPEEWLNFFGLTGSAFALYEGCNPVPGYEALGEIETYEKVLSEAERLDVIDRLQAFAVAAHSITNDNQGGSYHIVILRPHEKTVEIESFGKKKLPQANARYSDYESKIEAGDDIQVVLVATGSIDSLRQAYPNYFLDTHEFVNVIRRLEKKVAEANKAMHATSA